MTTRGKRWPHLGALCGGASSMFCSSIHPSLFPCFFAPICLSSRRQAGRPEVHVCVWLYACSGGKEQEGVGKCTAPVPSWIYGAANGKFQIPNGFDHLNGYDVFSYYRWHWACSFLGCQTGCKWEMLSLERPAVNVPSQTFEYQDLYVVLYLRKSNGTFRLHLLKMSLFCCQSPLKFFSSVCHVVVPLSPSLERQL